jgi:hypothetical protein
MADEFPPTRDFQWGLSKILLTQPHVKRVAAFCTIDNHRLVTSDGDATYFWTEEGLETKLKLPALALTYLEHSQHLIAFLRGSTQLHFIATWKPYEVMCHPTAFSGKTISSIAYFKDSQTIVTAGQGLHFTRVNLGSVPSSAYSSTVLKLSAITELHLDDIFTFVNPPLFVHEMQAVVIALERTLHVYSAEGRLIRTLRHISKANIGSMSFDADQRQLLVADVLGNLFCLEFGSVFSRTDLSIRPACHLLCAQLYDRHFVLTIGLDKIVSIYCLLNNSQMCQATVSDVPLAVRVSGNFAFIFSAMGMVAFRISSFLKHF